MTRYSNLIPFDVAPPLSILGDQAHRHAAPGRLQLPQIGRHGAVQFEVVS